MAQSEFERQMELGREAVREYQAQRRAEQAQQRREERERQREARRASGKRNKSLPLACRVVTNIDNALHDLFGAPRNY